MSNILRCPFCGRILEQTSIYNINAYACTDLTCEGYYMTATKDMWQELIKLMEENERTRKALDVATGFIKGISQTIINDCDNQYVVLGNFKKFAQNTLEQITALEQKDVK